MKNILLTGAPGSGKTTLIREILIHLHRTAGGFYTEEIRDEGGRQGFRLVTLDGREGILAHVALMSRERIGRYKVDVNVLETLAVDAVRAAMQAAELVVIDEIGPMELVSRKFRTVVVEALDGPAPVLGTIVQGRGRLPFADIVRARPDVTLLEVRRNNQDQVIRQVLQVLQLLQ
jgi:nucleoside-triphosphatase